MSCNRCSCDLPDDASFCLKCGADQHVPAEQGQRTGRVLRRSMTNRKIAGVCGGLAEYVNTDATIVRIAWAALAFVPGVVLYAAVAYPLAWLLMPGEKRQAPAKTNRQLNRSTNGRSASVGRAVGLARLCCRRHGRLCRCLAGDAYTTRAGHRRFDA